MAHGSTESLTLDPGQQQHDQEFATIEAELGRDFVHYDPSQAYVALARPEIPVGYRITRPKHGLPFDNIAGRLPSIERAVDRVLSGQVETEVLSITVTQTLCREQVVALEAEGLVFAGITEDHPDGGVYVNDRFKPSLILKSLTAANPEVARQQVLQAIYITGVLRGVTGLHARPPSPKIPDKLKGLPRIPTNSLVATVFNNGKWSQSHVLPDGRWIVEGFDSTVFQYGQGCFEGMVAADASENNEGKPVAAMEIEVEVKDEKVTLFRPEENAKRFIASCRRVGLPPVSVSQFIAAVTAAARNNKNFIPRNGKLYLRPFMVGLRGGTGIHPATQCLFAVEVSPYGEYMPAASAEEAETVSGVDLKSVRFDRPVFAKDKVIPNYSPLMPHKVQAEEEGFNDILTITSEGFIQECGSSNFFTVKKAQDGSFVFETPTLKENILPGITRGSLIELFMDPKIQERLGAKIHIIDYAQMHESMLNECDGAFGTGTAAGITNFKRIRTLDGRDKHFNDMETFRLLMKIKELLTDLRKGKVEGYKDWVMEV